MIITNAIYKVMHISFYTPFVKVTLWLKCWLAVKLCRVQCFAHSIYLYTSIYSNVVYLQLYKAFSLDNTFVLANQV